LFSNWLTYRAAAAALDERLRDAVIEEAFTQQKNELVVVARRDDEEVVLQFSAEPQFAWMLIKPDFARARRNSLDLFPDLIGDRIASVRIATDDRIVRVALHSGRALYAFLFPVRANLILTDADGIVREAFKHTPPPAAFHQLTYDNALPEWTSGDFVPRSDAKDDSVSALLRALRPWLAGRLAKEILHRAGVDAETAHTQLSTGQLDALHTSLSEVISESADGRGHLYLQDRFPVSVAPVVLRHVVADEHIDEDILAAMFTYLRRHFSGGELAAVRKRVLDRVQREQSRVRRSLDRLSSPDTLQKNADEYEKFGNLLMIHLYDQPEQPGRMTVPDVFTDPRLVVSIPIKERTSVLENAQRYFGKAQQARASVSYVRERTGTLTARLELLSRFEKDIRSAENLNELKTLFKQQATLMNELGMTSRGDNDESPFPFRRFVVEGGFEVWAGKNSANNDLLTVRHSRPNDLWFHARGVGGSHVVLKVGSAAGTPSKEAIRQAASIAAYYSKHRNAKRVPVAYTEKKYVRKPKGANPGSVLVDREKVIMADPALPSEEQ
jgi:predicted ribosome quality control (RQC) complex YloA/Tae2 family protein